MRIPPNKLANAIKKSSFFGCNYLKIKKKNKMILLSTQIYFNFLYPIPSKLS